MIWQTGSAPCVRRSGGSARGFTLIELMVAVAIVAVLAALAAPSFNEAILSNKLAAYANNFVASAQLARSEAIKRNATIVMCRSADGATCTAGGTWQQGWIVMCAQDPASPGVCHPGGAGTLVLQRQQALSSDYLGTGTFYSLDFLPSGGAQVSGGAPLTTDDAVTLCKAYPAPGPQERRIQVSLTGRTSVTKTTDGACS